MTGPTGRVSTIAVSFASNIRTIRTEKKNKKRSVAGRTRTDIPSHRPLPDQCKTPPEDLHRRGSRPQIPTAAPSAMLSWRAAVPATTVMGFGRGYMLWTTRIT